LKLKLNTSRGSFNPLDYAPLTTIDNHYITPLGRTIRACADWHAPNLTQETDMKLIFAAIIIVSLCIATTPAWACKKDESVRFGEKISKKQAHEAEKKLRAEQAPSEVIDSVAEATEDDVVVIMPEEETDEAPAIIVKEDQTVDETVGEALTVVIETNEALPREPERAGYCSPVVMVRPFEQPGIFWNLYADPVSRALYHSWGFTDALVDPVTGSIYC
jgi:hypothetical protein